MTNAALARFIAVTMTLLLALGSGCTPAPKVSYRFDSKTDFSAFRTYAMQPTKSPTLDLRTLDGKPMTRTIAESIARELDGRGLHPSADPASADLLVRWVGQIEYEAASGDVATPGVNVDQDLPDSGPILDSGPPGGVGVPGEITAGGIRVDLLNARTKQLVWRGGIGSILKPRQPDPERVKRLNAALAKLFANYPPPKMASAAASPPTR